MSTEFTVPAVDLSAYVDRGGPDERAAVAATVDTACREVGFIQVHGHGIPTAVLAGLGEAMDAFFAQTLEAKRAWVRPPAENRGYTPPKSESLSLSLGVESATRMNDFFEAFNVGRSVADYPALPPEVAGHYAANTWPDVAGFEAQVSAYFEHAARVAVTLTEVFADALGLPAGFFDTLADHSIDVLRMNNYALPEGTDVTLDGDLTGMGEHTDYGIVTVLWADQVRGLQVLGRDGRWHDVSPEDGALLVNLGDLTARLTNERWLSTLHRSSHRSSTAPSSAAARRRSSTTATPMPWSGPSPPASTRTTLRSTSRSRSTSTCAPSSRARASACATSRPSGRAVGCSGRTGSFQRCAREWSCGSSRVWCWPRQCC